MVIDLVRLLVDTGFFILIWAVQLVIYPSFKYYSVADLLIWHRQYTVRVTFIVLPLMFGQLIVAFYQFWLVVNWYTVTSLIIIVILWVLTFKVFVPLHASIDSASPKANACYKLETKNWIRTILWTSLFVISLFNFFM
jgi:hypothetical protein